MNAEVDEHAGQSKSCDDSLKMIKVETNIVQPVCQSDVLEENEVILRLQFPIHYRLRLQHFKKKLI